MLAHQVGASLPLALFIFAGSYFGFWKKDSPRLPKLEIALLFFIFWFIAFVLLTMFQLLLHSQDEMTKATVGRLWGPLIIGILIGRRLVSWRKKARSCVAAEQAIKAEPKIDVPIIINAAGSASWKCQGCGEAFDVKAKKCWACGMEREGSVNTLQDSSDKKEGGSIEGITATGKNKKATKSSKLVLIVVVAGCFLALIGLQWLKSSQLIMNENITSETALDIYEFRPEGKEFALSFPHKFKTRKTFIGEIEGVAAETISTEDGRPYLRAEIFDYSEDFNKSNLKNNFEDVLKNFCTISNISNAQVSVYDDRLVGTYIGFQEQRGMAFKFYGKVVLGKKSVVHLLSVELLKNSSSPSVLSFINSVDQKSEHF